MNLLFAFNLSRSPRRSVFNHTRSANDQSACFKVKHRHKVWLYH